MGCTGQCSYSAISCGHSVAEPGSSFGQNCFVHFSNLISFHRWFHYIYRLDCIGISRPFGIFDWGRSPSLCHAAPLSVGCMTGSRKSVYASIHSASRIRSEGYFAHPLHKLYLVLSAGKFEVKKLRLGHQIRGKLKKEFCANANLRLH